MAALSANQIVPEWSVGDTDITACYGLKNVNASDTADLSRFFSVLKWALAGPVSGTASPGTASVSGTQVTVPAGYSGDGCFVLVRGIGA